MKNTSEGINGKSKWGRKMNVLEDRLEQKKKEWKELRIVQETSGTMSNVLTFTV